jgi:TonB-dependent receptor
MVLDGAGNFRGFAPARAASDYVQLLPGLHVRYDSAPGTLWRGSITRSLSRPSYSDVVPFQTFSFVDRRLRIGNPALKPYQATNVDFSVDKYSDAHGLFSLALFYKKIDHFIADAQTGVNVGTLGRFIQFYRTNGDSALAMGVEGNWQSPTWDLPHALGRGSVTVNYSFTHGEAHYPTRPGEKFPLPDQVDYQGGITFKLERERFSTEGAVRYRSKWWEDLIAPGFDNYQTGYWDAELSGAYKLGKSSRVTLGIANLLNVPTRHYAGSLAHFNDYQRNGVDFTLGFQWKR